MKTKLLKSSALTATILIGAFLTMLVVNKMDDDNKESTKVESTNKNYYSINRDSLEGTHIDSKYTVSVENIAGLKSDAHDKMIEDIRMVREAEKERLAEIARVEAEKKAKEEAEKKKQEKLEREREVRRAERQVAQTEKSDVVSRGSGYQSNYETTFYTAQCDGCTGRSASGVWVNDSIYYQGYRIVAAPPSLAFYTKLRISFSDGSSMDAVVLDRGGDIQSGRLDILVGSKDEAYRLGRQQVKVEILSKP